MKVCIIINKTDDGMCVNYASISEDGLESYYRHCFYYFDAENTVKYITDQINEKHVDIMSDSKKLIKVFKKIKKSKYKENVNFICFPVDNEKINNVFNRLHMIYKENN